MKSQRVKYAIKRLSPHPEAWEKSGICAICGGKAEQFRDALSAKEYTISRMCQGCQDGVFGTDG
jgi:hypothetical protein